MRLCGNCLYCVPMQVVGKAPTTAAPLAVLPPELMLPVTIRNSQSPLSWPLFVPPLMLFATWLFVPEEILMPFRVLDRVVFPLISVGTLAPLPVPANRMPLPPLPLPTSPALLLETTLGLAEVPPVTS